MRSALMLGLILASLVITNIQGPSRHEAALALVTPTRTTTASPTRTPTRLQATPRSANGTPAPTPVAVIPMTALLKQMSFMFGGGGGLFNTECLDAATTYPGALPAIFLGNRTFNVVDLCILGLAVSQRLQISIADETGNIHGSGIYQIIDRFDDDFIGSGGSLELISLDGKAPAGDPPLGDYHNRPGENTPQLTFPVIGLKLWLPPERSGAWKISAESELSKISGTIQVDWPRDTAALLGPVLEKHPMEWPKSIYYLAEFSSSLYTLKPGQRLPVSGFQLPKNTSAPAALYRRATGNLISAVPVQSDMQGRISLEVTVDPKYPPGEYHLGYFLNPDAGPRKAGPFLGVYFDTCPGAPDSWITIGDVIEVNSDIPTANNIRSTPGLKGNVIGKFFPGQTAQVLDGIICADQMVWWKIRTSTGIEGWTSEGKGSERFLVTK